MNLRLSLRFLYVPVIAVLVSFSTASTSFSAGCLCRLFPIMNLGGLQLYVCDEFDPCDTIPDDCVNPVPKYDIDIPGLSESCPLGNCKLISLDGNAQGQKRPRIRLGTYRAPVGRSPFARFTATTVKHTVPILPAACDADYAGADLASTVKHETNAIDDVRFKTTDGRIKRARLLRITVAEEGKKPVICNVGCEIRDDGTDAINVNVIGIHNDHPYMYEVNIGATKYVIFTAK